MNEFGTGLRNRLSERAHLLPASRPTVPPAWLAVPPPRPVPVEEVEARFAGVTTQAEFDAVLRELAS